MTVGTGRPPRASYHRARCRTSAPDLVTSAPGVFSLSRRTWSWLAGVAVLTVAALLSTWIGDWTTRLDGGGEPRITTQALPPASLPPEDVRPAVARGELAPDDRDAAIVGDLEFLSWYAHRRQAGPPAATALPELPETLGDSESPEGNDAQ